MIVICSHHFQYPLCYQTIQHLSGHLICTINNFVSDLAVNYSLNLSDKIDKSIKLSQQQVQSELDKYVDDNTQHTCLVQILII